MLLNPSPKTNAAAAIVNVVLNYMLIPVFGYVAAGYTTLIGYILYLVMHFLSTKRILSKNKRENPLDNRYLLICSVLVLVLSAVVQGLYSYTPLRYAVIAGAVIIAIWKKERVVLIMKKFKKALHI